MILMKWRVACGSALNSFCSWSFVRVSLSLETSIDPFFQVTEGNLYMEGEEEILRGNEVKFFDLFPERSYKQGSIFDFNRLKTHRNFPLFENQVRQLKFIFVWLSHNFTVCWAATQRKFLRKTNYRKTWQIFLILGLKWAKLNTFVTQN